MYRITYFEQGKQKWWKQVYNTEHDAQQAVIQLRSIRVNAFYYSIRAKLEKAKKSLAKAKEMNRRVASQNLGTAIQNDIVVDTVACQKGAEAIKQGAEMDGQVEALADVLADSEAEADVEASQL